MKTESQHTSDIPQWQKDLNIVRLEEYRNNPQIALDWYEVSKELDQEDQES